MTQPVVVMPSGMGASPSAMQSRPGATTHFQSVCAPGHRPMQPTTAIPYSGQSAGPVTTVNLAQPHNPLQARQVHMGSQAFTLGRGFPAPPPVSMPIHGQHLQPHMLPQGGPLLQTPGFRNSQVQPVGINTTGPMQVAPLQMPSLPPQKLDPAAVAAAAIAATGGSGMFPMSPEVQKQLDDRMKELEFLSQELVTLQQNVAIERGRLRWQAEGDAANANLVPKISLREELANACAECADFAEEISRVAEVSTQLNSWFKENGSNLRTEGRRASPPEFLASQTAELKVMIEGVQNDMDRALAIFFAADVTVPDKTASPSGSTCGNEQKIPQDKTALGESAERCLDTGGAREGASASTVAADNFAAPRPSKVLLPAGFSSTCAGTPFKSENPAESAVEFMPWVLASPVGVSPALSSTASSVVVCSSGAASFIGSPNKTLIQVFDEQEAEPVEFHIGENPGLPVDHTSNPNDPADAVEHISSGQNVYESGELSSRDCDGGPEGLPHSFESFVISTEV